MIRIKKLSRLINWEIKASHFLYLVVLLNLLLFNIPLFEYVFDNVEFITLTGLKVIFLLSVVVLALTYLLLAWVSLISLKLLKLFVFLIVFLNSACLYFMTSYQIMMDKAMMGNVFNTQMSESGELLSVKLCFYLLFVGLVSSVFLLNIVIKKPYRLNVCKHILIHIFAFLFVAYVCSSSWLWIDKHAKHLGGRILPWSYLSNSARLYFEKRKHNKQQALLPPLKFDDQSKQVVVLVIGETARAENFSLYGYHRKTNPFLEQESIKTFPNTQSCSTYTTASIECLLSHSSDTGGFSSEFEPLPSYLSRHGVDVIWRSNNWGEPKIKVNSYIKAAALKGNCDEEGCQHDEVLLKGLVEQINHSVSNKVFVVIHQKGSHGPLYAQRYPSEFEYFKPACQTVDLAKCSQEELTNAYDNSIRYTDYFLATLINQLKSITDRQATMFYISDHGESLGENGLYLHGTPISIAPKEQYVIPFLLWRSDFSESKQKTREPKATTFTQHHIFHSVIGALGGVSGIYQRTLDVNEL